MFWPHPPGLQPWLSMTSSPPHGGALPHVVLVNEGYYSCCIRINNHHRRPVSFLHFITVAPFIQVHRILNASIFFLFFPINHLVVWCFRDERVETAAVAVTWREENIDRSFSVMKADPE